MSRPRITPYDPVKVISVPSTVYPSGAFPSSFYHTRLADLPDLASLRDPRIRVQPDPFRDEHGPNFLRKVYCPDGTCHLYHDENCKTHEVISATRGDFYKGPDTALLYHRGSNLPYLLEKVSQEELEWLQDLSPATVPTLINSGIDPYRQPGPVVLKRYDWDDGSFHLYLSFGHELGHEVNEVVNITPVDPITPATVALTLKGQSVEYYLTDVSQEEYIWLKGGRV